MENELEKVLESKFFCPARFAQEIETLVHGENNMSYIDAIIYFCEKNSIDLDSVPKLISKPLKEKIKYEAMEINFLKRSSSAKLPFDAYKQYLSLKNHFTKEKYDYHKYCGKSRATVQSFYKRKDRFWFEKLARNKDDKEVVEFFISNFITCTDPSKLWIGELIREGEVRYTSWKKRTQSMSYMFKGEIEELLSEKKLDDLFSSKSGHPTILKKYLGGDISIETMVILDRILEFRKNFDNDLQDPVWETVSMRMKKYSPFLNIDVPRYKKILREVAVG